jgi:hypothetical protein
MRLTPEQQIPKTIRRYAEEQRLGTPRILYESSSDSRLNMILGPITVLIGCIIIALYNSWYRDVFSWWPVWQATIVLMTGIAWLCVGLWICIGPLFSPRIRIYLCPKGLIYLKHRISAIHWGDICQCWKNVHLDKKARISYSYTLRCNNGSTFALTKDLPHVERLGGFLEHETTRQLLGQSITACRAGKDVTFATIQVNREGIRLKSEHKMLAWRDVDRLTTDKTTISIYCKNDSWEWATLNISGIPNVGVLKGLVDALREETLNAHLPQLQAYHAGLTLYFGKIGISQNGVYFNDDEELLPWNEITSFGIGENEIIIHRRGLVERWYTMPIWMVTDAPVLKELVDYILQKQS